MKNVFIDGRVSRHMNGASDMGRRRFHAGNEYTRRRKGIFRAENIFPDNDEGSLPLRDIIQRIRRELSQPKNKFPQEKKADFRPKNKFPHEGKGDFRPENRFPCKGKEDFRPKYIFPHKGNGDSRPKHMIPDRKKVYGRVWDGLIK